MAAFYKAHVEIVQSILRIVLLYRERNRVNQRERRGGNAPALHRCNLLFMISTQNVYRKRTDWWAWLAILTLQLECAHEQPGESRLLSISQIYKPNSQIQPGDVYHD